MTPPPPPLDAEVFQRTGAGQREAVCGANPLYPDARRLLLLVNGHTPLYLLGVHNRAATSFDNVAALLDLGLIEAAVTP